MFYSLVDYATGNVCANFHGDCAIDGRDLRGGGVDSTPPPPPATEQPKKPGLVRVKIVPVLNHVESDNLKRQPVKAFLRMGI